jgi:two-component system, OmpR family, response regulator ResD
MNIVFIFGVATSWNGRPLKGGLEREISLENANYSIRTALWQRQKHMTRALVVEDTPAFQTIISMALEFAGFEVDVVSNGVEALKRLREQTFHIMFLDLNMPTMSGSTVLRVIRQMGTYDHMHVVVVTANSHMSNDEIDDLADFVMLKPLDVEDLARFAQRLLKTTRSVSIHRGAER